MTEKYVRKICYDCSCWGVLDFDEYSEEQIAYAQSEKMMLVNCEKAFNNIFYITGFAPQAPVPTYAEARAAAYPEVIEQLDCLYHDIAGGLLGEPAKESSFYLARKTVKDEFPKPME